MSVVSAWVGCIVISAEAVPPSAEGGSMTDMARGGLLEVGKGPFVTWVMGTRDWPKNDFTKPFFSYVVSWTWVLFYVKKKKNF